MGAVLFSEPELDNPVLIASWPGIGNIGILAVDTLRGAVKAEELGEIEAWNYLYPRKAVIKNGILQRLEFPSYKFFYKKTGKQDLLFFLGEEQPTEGGKTYAEGSKAYQMANLVLDVALRFGCRRVYTSGAAVATIHHSARSRVWAVPSVEALVDEIRGYRNTVLMSDVEGRGGQGNITGLNGLLLGVAKKRGLEAMCLMGEIPVYLQGLPIAYPKASKSVLEVLTAALGIDVEMEGLASLVQRTDQDIDRLYHSFIPEVREQIDKLKYVTQDEAAGPGPITDEDKKRILDDIDKLFKTEPKED